MASYALALSEPQTRRAPLFGTRAQLATQSGRIEGALALTGYEKRAGTAGYALRIVNESAQALRARMTCARMHGDRVLAYPLDIQIAPFSISETLLPVRVADVGPYDRAIVEVAGGEVAFTLEAPAPKRKRKRAKLIGAGGCALAITLLSAFGAAWATPHITMISAPARALAGTRIDVPYTFGGVASMRYALLTPDGRQIAAGLATAREGTLHFNVPAAAGRRLLLAETLAGPFGTRTAEQRIAVEPSQAPRAASAPAPHIGEFVLATRAVHAGGKIEFRYATNASSGEIWLVDEAGHLWASAPMNLSGSVVMTVPHGTSGRKLRAVLRARKGSASALSSVAFTVVPWEDEGAAPAAAAPATAEPALTLSTAAAAPGETVTVSIAGTHGDTQISLTDAAGTTIEQGDIPAGQSAVTITAPSVTAATTYYITAALAQGAGEQTLVKKLLVAPR